MAIQLIDYADKSSGASGATGQVSSADINQIKSKANAALAFLNSLAGLFTLDTNGLPTVIKDTSLPSVNLASLFSSDFVVSNGVISLAGGNQLPVPPSLTNGVVDDSADTFTATIPSGYAATDLERTFDGGTTWATITSLPISVGNIALAIGKVGLRIKATSERQHSTTLFNQTAFTVSGGGISNVDDGFTAVNTFEQVDTDITQNGNSFSYVYNAVNGTNRFFANNSLKATAGSQFELRFTIDPTKPGGFLGLAQVGQGYSPNRMDWIRSSNTHGSMQAILGNSYQPLTGVDITVPARGRLTSDGTTLSADYSLDGGTVWTNIGTVAAPTTDQHIQGQFIAHDDVTTGAVNNIMQKGFVAA